MNNSFKLMILGVLVGSMLLAGCAQQQNQPEENMSPNISMDDETDMDDEEPETQIVEVTETDDNIELSETSVESGEVRFEVANSGTLYHEFEIEGNGVEEVIEGGIPAGESRTLTVDLEPGTYEIYCPIPGNPSHRERGMEATLTVE